jgi:hypothetical protein
MTTIVARFRTISPSNHHSGQSLSRSGLSAKRQSQGKHLLFFAGVGTDLTGKRAETVAHQPYVFVNELPARRILSLAEFA